MSGGSSSSASSSSTTTVVAAVCVICARTCGSTATFLCFGCHHMAHLHCVFNHNSACKHLIGMKQRPHDHDCYQCAAAAAVSSTSLSLSRSLLAQPPASRELKGGGADADDFGEFTWSNDSEPCVLCTRDYDGCDSYVARNRRSKFSALFASSSSTNNIPCPAFARLHPNWAFLTYVQSYSAKVLQDMAQMRITMRSLVEDGLQLEEWFARGFTCAMLASLAPSSESSIAELWNALRLDHSHFTACIAPGETWSRYTGLDIQHIAAMRLSMDDYTKIRESDARILGFDLTTACSTGALVRLEPPPPLGSPLL